MEIQEIKKHIEKFLKYANDNKIELYNEVSLQHELGIYLRNELKREKYAVQFERNISFFGYDEKSLPSKNNEQGWIKKEIDIVIFNDKESFAIELKFPRKRAYPRRMFQFVEDIRFLEQLKEASKKEMSEPKFKGGCTFVLVDDKNFCTGSEGKSSGIYEYFRNPQKVINGKIENPIKGETPEYICIDENYKIDWRDEIEFYDSYYDSKAKKIKKEIKKGWYYIVTI